MNIHGSVISYRQKLETPPMSMYRSAVAHLHDATTLQWKGTTKVYNNIVISFKNLMLKRMHNMWFYLCETLEQAELLHSDKNQINSCPEMRTKEGEMTVKGYVGTPMRWQKCSLPYHSSYGYVCQNSLTCTFKIIAFYYM